MRKWFQIFFFIAGILTILEYMFVCGMFTSLMAMALVWIAGIANLIYAIKDKDHHAALLYALSTVGLLEAHVWTIMHLSHGLPFDSFENHDEQG